MEASLTLVKLADERPHVFLARRKRAIVTRKMADDETMSAEEEAFDAMLQERVRQIDQLDTPELDGLFDAAVMTLSCRRQANVPGEAAAHVTEMFLGDNEEDWLGLYEANADALPAEPLDASDPEHLTAQLSGRDLALLITLCACAKALSTEDGMPAQVLAQWMADHPVWEEGAPERLNGLTQSVWQARHMMTVEERIAEHGYTYTFVMSDPSFCYTTGLWQTFQHPELLLFGPGQEQAAGCSAR